MVEAFRGVSVFVACLMTLAVLVAFFGAAGVDPGSFLEWLFIDLPMVPVEMWRRRKWDKDRNRIYASKVSPAEAKRYCVWLHAKLKPYTKMLVQFFSYTPDYELRRTLRNYYEWDFSPNFGIGLQEARNAFQDLTKEPFCSRLSSQDLVSIDAAFKQVMTVVSDIERLALHYRNNFSGLEDTEAHKTAVRELLEQSQALRETLDAAITQLRSIKEAAALRKVSDVSGTAQKDLVVTYKTTMRRVLDLAQGCGSDAVYTRLTGLSAKLDSEPAAQTYERMVMFYLPSLAGFVEAIASAHKNNSEKVQELESLCLQAIDVIEEVIDGRSQETDETQVRTVEADLATLRNFATLKGDIANDLEFTVVEQG